MINLNKARYLAIHLARESGDILLKSLNKIKITEIKDKEDFCTNIDLKIEKLIVKAIHSKYPDHNILSEEVGDLNKESDYLWVIDPIDGTKHFIKKVPLFTVCIALQYKKEIVMGVVYNPSTHHMYHARQDGGAHLNNKRISVSRTSRLDHSFVYVDISKIHHLPKKEIRESLKRLNNLILDTYRVRALGIGSLGMCYLAQGAYDVYFDLTGKTKYVDIAAGSVVVKEAGGRVTDLEGKKISRRTKHFLATNTRLHKKIKEVLEI